jgi:hypothetical protein
MNEPAKSAVIVNDQRMRREEPVRTNTLPSNPLEMLAVAQQRGASIEELQKFMDLQERWEKNEATKAYVAALAAFKAEPLTITKDKHVVYPNSKGGNTDYWHATIGNVVSVVGPALSRHGLSYRWKTEQLDGGQIRVTCILTHVQGHSEETSLCSSRDDSGGKNNIQAVGSTVSYLQRYTLLALTGLATHDQEDDDGKGAGKAPQKPEEPKGYNDWVLDMEALADEGLPRLQGAWSKASDEFKRYTVKHEGAWWASVKTKAGKVKP